MPDIITPIDWLRRRHYAISRLHYSHWLLMYMPHLLLRCFIADAITAIYIYITILPLIFSHYWCHYIDIIITLFIAAIILLMPFMLTLRIDIWLYFIDLRFH